MESDCDGVGTSWEKFGKENRGHSKGEGYDQREGDDG